jgi:hypothetical protein
MTNEEGSDEAGAYSKGDDAPGWAMPIPGPESPDPPARAGDDNNTPLTPLQQAVISEVADGQHALGNEMRWKRRSRLDLLGGIGGGIVGLGVDSVLASKAARQVSESERAAQFLVDTPQTGQDAEPNFPSGGPPTPEEVHDAEMHPWPHHGMAETIEHNRQLHEVSGAPSDGGSPPDAPSQVD